MAVLFALGIFFLLTALGATQAQSREEYRGEKRDVKKNIGDCYNCKL
jgi:hypothetical protein